MRILEKEADQISIIALPAENVFQGDYLEIIDSSGPGSVVIQVFDETYIPSQSLTEDIIREQIIESSASGTEMVSVRDFQRVPDDQGHAAPQMQDSRMHPEWADDPERVLLPSRMCSRDGKSRNQNSACRQALADELEASAEECPLNPPADSKFARIEIEESQIDGAATAPLEYAHGRWDESAEDDEESPVAHLVDDESSEFDFQLMTPYGDNDRAREDMTEAGMSPTTPADGLGHDFGIHLVEEGLATEPSRPQSFPDLISSAIEPLPVICTNSTDYAGDNSPPTPLRTPARQSPLRRVLGFCFGIIPGCVICLGLWLAGLEPPHAWRICRDQPGLRSRSARPLRFRALRLLNKPLTMRSRRPAANPLRKRAVHRLPSNISMKF